jgi:hypothetical protein
MSDRVTCPKCGAVERDLDDYEWGSREELTATCDACGSDYTLCRRVSVSYEAKPMPKVEAELLATATDGPHK